MAPVLREVASLGDISERWHQLPIAVRREIIRLVMTVRIMPAVRGALPSTPMRSRSARDRAPGQEGRQGVLRRGLMATQGGQRRTRPRP